MIFCRLLLAVNCTLSGCHRCEALTPHLLLAGAGRVSLLGCCLSCHPDMGKELIW